MVRVKYLVVMVTVIGSCMLSVIFVFTNKEGQMSLFMCVCLINKFSCRVLASNSLEWWQHNECLSIHSLMDTTPPFSSSFSFIAFCGMFWHQCLLFFIASFENIRQTSVYSHLICNPTGFQLHSGSQGGAVQPAFRQSRAGYDQTL